MKVFLFVLCFAILSSCADFSKGSQLETIGQLNKTVDSIQTVLLENKIEEIEDLSIEAEAIITRIKENSGSDTIELTDAKQIDSYNRMYHSIEPLIANYPLLLTNIKKEKETLQKIQHDIENGFGDRKKYDENVTFEVDKVHQLRESLHEYVVLRKKTIDIHLKLHDKLYVYSFNLITK